MEVNDVRYLGKNAKQRSILQEAIFHRLEQNQSSNSDGSSPYTMKVTLNEMNKY